MENKIIILNTTVFDGRLTISFSYPPSAQNYKEYLKNPENTYDKDHEWNLYITGLQVSMDLPPNIAHETPDGSKNAVLVFEDEAKATRWEEKMIVWRDNGSGEGTKRSISRSMTVGRLNEKLGFPERTFKFGERGIPHETLLAITQRREFVRAFLGRLKISSG